MIQHQLSAYLMEMLNNFKLACAEPFEFWHQRSGPLCILSQVAQDLLSCPASEAYVKRIFSICGMLTDGIRNRDNFYGNALLAKTEQERVQLNWTDNNAFCFGDLMFKFLLVDVLLC